MFGWFSDDEYDCGHHHFGEWSENDEWEIETKRACVLEDDRGELHVEFGHFALETCDTLGSEIVRVIKRQRVNRCSHTKCHKKRETWHREEVITEDDELLDLDEFEERLVDKHTPDEE